MRNISCGIDFGTSNSTVGVCASNWSDLILVDEEKRTMPSAIFFPTGRQGIAYGRAAIRDYLDEEPGRLLRALKSLLGTRTIDDRTYVQGRSVTFVDILSVFLRRLRDLANESAGCDIGDVVLGRPVFFIERDADLDRKAEADLGKAALAAGFRNIEFQYEPIAAALEYEREVEREELVFVADIGGGTSDFTVIRVSPERAKTADRRDDVLSNSGARVGGTDFDRFLALATVMPHLGLGSTYSAKQLEVPRGIYYDLATWSRVNFVYEDKTVRDLRTVARQSNSPELTARLMNVVEKRHGHRLIGETENAKIALTEQDHTSLSLAFVENGLAVEIDRVDFEAAIGRAVQRIDAAILEAMQQAGIADRDVDTVFLTGGSALVPIVQRIVMGHFPNAQLRTGDMLSSVGRGLTLEAERRFSGSLLSR